MPIDVFNIAMWDSWGKTIGQSIWKERIGNVQVKDADVIRDKENAYSQTGGLAVLLGGLEQDCTVVKKSLCFSR